MADLPELLKESWALVEEHQEKLASYFYARLFLTDPRVRDLFPITMDVQRSRLLRAIVTAVQTVGDPDTFGAYLHGLGRDHRKFYVTPAHYDLVGGVLLESLRAFAGRAWSVAYDQAWADAYAEIAATMQAGAAADENPPFWHAEVLAHERRGRDVAVLRVLPFQPLNYRAGQYVSVESGYQPRLWRSYSPANAPRADNTIELHVRAVNGGLVSSALVRRASAGHVLRLGAPMGSMMLDPTSPRDVLCVAGGTGLAPLKAIVEEVSRRDRPPRVHLFLGVRCREDFYDVPALSNWLARFPWLSVTAACSDDPDFPGDRGLIPDVLARHGSWRERDVFVAGSPAMVQATLRRLADMGVPSSQVRFDAFSD